MTPLRAKYIQDLGIRGRSENTQEVYTRYVCDLARYYRRSPELISYEEVTGWLYQEVTDWVYHLITERLHLSLQRKRRRQRRALSLRRNTRARMNRVRVLRPVLFSLTCMNLFVADYGSDQKRSPYCRHNKKKHSKYEGEI